jgi:acetyl-CoA C-acetyltransferase
MNNYASHAVATMVPLLRQTPGSMGLVSAVGGMMAKHAMGVYSAAMPPQGYRYENVQIRLGRVPRRELAVDYAGEATVEAYTVMHEKDSPPVALFSLLLPDGRRAWGSSAEPLLVAESQRGELCGSTARRSEDGLIEIVRRVE